MFQKRVDQVIARMKADGLKQILVSEPCSIYYLTGVDVGPGERLFALYLNDEGRKVLFLNTLFTVEQKDCEEIWYSDTDDSTSLLVLRTFPLKESRNVLSNLYQHLAFHLNQ